MNPTTSINQGPIRTPTVGDVLHSSWGYDQTNATFYLVTKVTGSRITVQELRNIETPVKGTPMFGTAIPDMGSHRGTPMVKKANLCGEFYGVKISNYASAYLWDGKPAEVSHTH